MKLKMEKLLAKGDSVPNVVRGYLWQTMEIDIPVVSVDIRSLKRSKGPVG